MIKLSSSHYCFVCEMCGDTNFKLHPDMTAKCSCSAVYAIRKTVNNSYNWTLLNPDDFEDEKDTDEYDYEDDE